jgi:hypothetical protein
MDSGADRASARLKRSSANKNPFQQTRNYAEHPVVGRMNLALDEAEL